ncbi:MAG TPA: Clp protease N-terminal domain-containing protein [Acidimicrobiales bacterium]|nr:Clp protease N-terminal domain-containing protein [Acidimicrobiales bacterium]
MFKRFTSGAREVVKRAQAEARDLGHGWIGTEHLLLGLLGEGEGIAARALRAAGITARVVRDEIERLVEPLISGPDADALRAIGIDVEHVRARIEESFGPGALERARLGGCRRGPSRAFIPFSCRSKKVLELSLREALRLRHNYIGTEHILLALLREGQGLAAQILVRSGVRADDLRRAVLAALGKVA